MSRLRILLAGLGPIGRAAGAMAAERADIEIAGAADPAPEWRDRSLADAFESAPDLPVDADTVDAADRLSPDVVVHCASSFMHVVQPELVELARRGVNVVSSTEEMLDPWFASPELADALDREAVSGNATLLGTGVNPGFALDLLPVVASSACRRVDRVEARRVVDAATRREPLQRKVGAGLTVEAFQAKAERDELGHRGMRESVSIVARALGWKVDAIEQSLEPVVSDRRIQTAYLVVEAGRVAGIHNVGWARLDGEEAIRLDLVMAVGAADPVDEARIHGVPELTLRVEGGTPGDVATAAILVNAIPTVAAAPPGLKTILDLPLSPCRR